MAEHRSPLTPTLASNLCENTFSTAAHLSLAFEHVADGVVAGVKTEMSYLDFSSERVENSIMHEERTEKKFAVIAQFTN